MLDDEALGPFSNHADLDALAHRFFRQFSRTEYALKATGLMKRPTGSAEADWQAFGNEIDQAFLAIRNQREELREACDYMLNRPPKKQVAKDGNLSWSDRKPEAKTETALLLQYVCRVRNNLFHGGKFNGQWFDPERSEELLRHALTILGHSVPQSQRVLAAYTH